MLLRSLRTASSLNLVRLMRAIGLRVSLRLRPWVRIGRLPASGSGRKSRPVLVPIRRYLLSKMAPQSGWALRVKPIEGVMGARLRPMSLRVGGAAVEGRSGPGVAKPIVTAGEIGAEADRGRAPFLVAWVKDGGLLLTVGIDGEAAILGDRSELALAIPAKVAAAIDLGVRLSWAE